MLVRMLTGRSKSFEPLVFESSFAYYGPAQYQYFSKQNKRQYISCRLSNESGPGQAWTALADLPLVLKVKRLGERFPLETERDKHGD